MKKRNETQLEKFMMYMTGQSEMVRFLLDVGQLRNFSIITRAVVTRHHKISESLKKKKGICPGLCPEDNENVTYPSGNVGAGKEASED